MLSSKCFRNSISCALFHHKISQRNSRLYSAWDWVTAVCRGKHDYVSSVLCIKEYIAKAVDGQKQKFTFNLDNTRHFLYDSY